MKISLIFVAFSENMNFNTYFLILLTRLKLNDNFTKKKTSGVSSKAMYIMNSLVNDLFERIASESWPTTTRGKFY